MPTSNNSIEKYLAAGKSQRAAKAAEILRTNAKVSIRWRKSSATFVIYIAGKVFESGFDGYKEARTYLADKLGPEVAARVAPQT